ncbi:MAG: class I SAM-dependent methyltransferase [Actinobacteria bacterium]|nr:class I SAM-dependent methyltransferase [Actinomycetota bacterium]
MTVATGELELTGERTLPGIPRENYWYQRHLTAYELAANLAEGKKVIDVGCGEGYGPAMLARHAGQVLGVDIAPEVIGHAIRRYTSQNLSFRVMGVNRLEVPPQSFDLAVSLQVVEHLADVSGYFAEIARVLAPEGVALLSTPNRLTISPGSSRPINPFHLREYTPQEFRDVLGGYFEGVEIRGLFHARWLKLNEKVPLVDFIKFYEMKKYNPRYWAHRLLAPLVSTADFRVGASGIENCLDIIAICRRQTLELAL